MTFCVSFFLLSIQAQASTLNDLRAAAQEHDLAHNPTWLKLIHFEGPKNSSVVLTDTFFLSPNGRSDPVAEFEATLAAYFDPWERNGNEHARCRFPARYYWLSHQVPLPDYALREDRCQNLEDWALFDSVKSVSLLLVSGYLGNPASTFGHALLKFNTDAPDDKAGLFDLTLNYGAMVPENELILKYIARGLFGGYQAGFSDKYFYTQDIVYSRTEFRDIWDYRLNLTDYERTLLMLHIWEIVGNKFTYYFLKKNCAYRLAELVDLVTPEDLVSNGRFWYVPVELFHRLNDVDAARQASGQPGLVSSVYFIPSSQRELYYRLKQLTADELKIFNAIVRDGIASIPQHLSQLLVEQQILVLDSLLAYQQYRLVAQDPDSDRQRREIKDKILLARLQLPIHPAPVVNIPVLPSPADGFRPIEMSIGIAAENSKDPFMRLTLSPFKQETVGQNSLEGDELVVFDLALGFLEKNNKVLVDKFDLIRIRNLNTLSVEVVDENRLSWELRIGMDRTKKNGKERYDGRVSFGAGPAWKWNDAMVGYGMMEMAAHNLSPYPRMRPHAGIIFDLGKLRAWVYGGAETSDYNLNVREIWGGKIQYKLTDRSSVRFEFSNEIATRTSLGLNWYW